MEAGLIRVRQKVQENKKEVQTNKAEEFQGDDVKVDLQTSRIPWLLKPIVGTYSGFFGLSILYVPQTKMSSELPKLWSLNTQPHGDGRRNSCSQSQQRIVMGIGGEEFVVILLPTIFSLCFVDKFASSSVGPSRCINDAGRFFISNCSAQPCLEKTSDLYSRKTPASYRFVRGEP